LIDTFHTPVGIIIPARIDSSRLARKLLIEVNGLPMIEHVRRRALLNSYSLPVIVASGDEEILNAVNKHGGETIKSELSHENGLSRVGEASLKLNWSKYIILQGDEILIKPDDLDSFINSTVSNQDLESMNMITELKDADDIQNSSIVKCLIKKNRDIAFIFRRTPLLTDYKEQLKLIYKICGLFSIGHKTLHSVLSQANTPISEIESIEQLKLIELGVRLESCFTYSDYPSVNLAKDLELVTEIFKNDHEQKMILDKIM
jgi:3-deoxy-manno-octulosonate cytidylyltransferase (CMP-KDO synthetase)